MSYERSRSAEQSPYWLSQDEGSGGGDFLNELTAAARENPLSTALIGLGVLWLFAGGGAKTLLRNGRGQNFRRRLGQAPRATGRMVSSGVRSAGGAMAGGVASIGESAARAGSRLGHAASSAAAQATRGMSFTAHGIGSATQRAAANIPRASSKPWALGAVGLAIGAGLGAALPSTASERRVLGQTSDAVKDRARSMAGEQLNTLRSAAEKMVHQAEKSLRDT